MNLKQSRETFISAIIALHHDTKSAGIFTPYIAEYYADLPLEDFTLKEPTDWYGAVQAHWHLAEKRLPQEINLRVYNPEFEEHGWQNGHTIVEIVQNNIPFLVDTVKITLHRLGYTNHLLIHPIFKVLRDSRGHIEKINNSEGCAESWIHIEFDRETQPERLALIHSAIQEALLKLVACVEDWPKMLTSVHEEVKQFEETSLPLDAKEIVEAKAFLTWLLSDNFVFLGCCDYILSDESDAASLNAIPQSGLGLLRDKENRVAQSFVTLSDHPQTFIQSPSLLVLTQSNTRAFIHRAAYMDIVFIKHFDQNGRVIGARKLIGLYTANAYNTPNRQIPVLRSKIEAVLTQTHADLAGHKGKKLLNILDTYPRDELIEISISELSHIAAGISSLQDRKQTRVFIREDIHRRYVSAMLFMPKDNYNTDVITHIEKILLNAFQGKSVESTVQLSDALLARIHFIIRIDANNTLTYDIETIEADIIAAARRWQDELYIQLLQHAGEEQGFRLFQRYHHAFSASYCADFNARTAVYDIDRLEKSLKTNQLQIVLTPASLTDPSECRLRLYHQRAIDLSDTLPILDNMGVRIIEERPYYIHYTDETTGWISDIGIRLPMEGIADNETLRHHFQEGFLAIFAGQAENDSLNKLILYAGLSSREAMLIRAYLFYIKQLGISYDPATATDYLVKHAHIVTLFMQFILARHKPDQAQTEVADSLAHSIEHAISEIKNQDEEKLLSGTWEAVHATLRMNYFQKNAEGQHKDYISFKIASQNIRYMPQPVPLYEIFVYSPRIEGVHLRGGKVARGGLRWSDRREDFRTEVLGLVKAQMVKNAVIVPVGSKGGFVCKQIPINADRATIQAEGIACYRTFISGLLDLTDNIVNSAVVPPKDMVRLDEDDPYLVVAADKGTASFSDIANSVSQAYQFWMDDAFASGGEYGYDHKKMGITAKGAWESAKRQFRELGQNIQTTPFTVIGIGDMAGDVFGNGMLLSECTQLVAAFNHQHIFFDPKPNISQSFQERQRIFNLSQSSWEDYDKSLISQGGGVFSRHMRTIPLSPEIRALLQIEETELSPNELINVMLKAPVDMIYNGGIGTYVKASTQSHTEINDKANDALRVNGNEIRAQVIIEGGNLGLSQLGRIEYAQNLGNIYTDAIDNSAGVDCSDHEVNIKILLGMFVRNGDMTIKQRNTLTASMTEEVAQLVLRDNYLQTQAISLEALQATLLSSVHRRFMTYLEKAGKLSRRIEYLPNDKQLIDRLENQQGLTKPEIAVLLAYAKMDLYQQLLDSSLPDQDIWDHLLVEYFPSILSTQFATLLPQHSLRREIIATSLTNRIVNRMGVSFVFRVQEEMEVDITTILQAWYQAATALNSERLFDEIEALDNQINTQTQYAMLLQVRRQLERVTRWVLHLCQTGKDASAVFDTLRDHMPAQLNLVGRGVKDSPTHQALIQQWIQAGVPDKQAKMIACLDTVIPLLNSAQIAEELNYPVDDITKLYFKLAHIVRLNWLTSLIEALPRQNRWQTLARLACRYDIYQAFSRLVEHVLKSSQEKSIDITLANWLENNTAEIEHCHHLFEELEQSPPDLAMISAAIREISQKLVH